MCGVKAILMFENTVKGKLIQDNRQKRGLENRKITHITRINIRIYISYSKSTKQKFQKHSKGHIQ